MTLHRAVVLVAGSPSAQSRSHKVLTHLEVRLQKLGVDTRLHAVRDFPAEALLNADTNAPAVQAFIESVKSASAIVLGTPVYKATYSGVLKALVDLVPPDALVGKVALGVATARLPAHLATTAQAFDGLFAFFRVGRPLPAVLLTDDQVRTEGDAVSFDAAATAALDAALDALRAARQEA